MIVPFTSDVNFTPSSVDAGVGLVGVDGVADDGQIVHADATHRRGGDRVRRRRSRARADGVRGRHRERVGVPLVSPLTVALVAGGFPVTVVGVCAVVPMNGVTV